MDLPSTSSQGGGNEVVRSNMVLKKNKLVRGIKRLLYSFGCDREGKSLEKGPGIELHKERVDLFIEQILDGKWDESLSTLRDIGKKYVDKISLLILEHKFYELLSGDKVIEASKTLRYEIAPLENSDEITRKLSALILSPSQNLCGQESGLWFRSRVLEDLENLLLTTKSLKFNHQRGKDEVPYNTQTLKSSGQGEVWSMQFSDCGQYLAATSGNRVNMWEFRESGSIVPWSTLVGHIQPVSYITWRSNALQLLTCGVEENVRRWNTSRTGICLHTYRRENLGTVSCAWAPDGESIFAGLNNGSIVMWNLQGEELRIWEGSRTTRIADLAIARGSGELITTCNYRTIRFFGWETGAERFINEDADIVSFSVSEDGFYLLVSLANETIDLWDIRPENPGLLKTFEGHKRKRYVVRACFCGLFIASGSEDSKVYVWHRGTGRLVGVFVGHSDTVNCVSWNRARHLMLVSGSDDRIVKGWDVLETTYSTVLIRERDYLVLQVRQLIEMMNQLQI
ncbi:hypothetical protein ABFX02_13G011900 [Erythranthe guttata]